MADETSTHQGQGEIIIVKKIQGGGGGHHGGAWKIAYADFVTAMMAFFLVMWLVNAANEDTKASVASYFNPIKLTDQQPSEKGVKKAGETAEGEQTSAKSKSEGEEETTGDGKSDGNQETSTAGEESENSEADYFENPYAVLAEIVMDAAEESNISEKGDGGAQNSGSATGASGGEAYRDPFDPDFWNKQVTANPDASTNPESSPESGEEETLLAEEDGPSELEMGAGDVFGKTAGAGDIVAKGAGLSDHDTGGDKSGLSPFEGEQGGKMHDFETAGQHISNLPDEGKTSNTLPSGDTPIDQIDPTNLATLFKEGTLKLDDIRQKGMKKRLSGEEAEELQKLAKKSKQEGLTEQEKQKLEELLAKNDLARIAVAEAAEMEKNLKEFEEQLGEGEFSEEGKEFIRQLLNDSDIEMAELEVEDEGLSDAEQLEKRIMSALGGKLGKLAEGLEVYPAEGGLLLSLTDQRNIGMFNVGSAVPRREMILLMDEIGEVLNERDGVIAIRGHTDSRPFSSGGNDNWRLSMARAHSAYFMLVRGGIPEERITQVSGFADRRLKTPEEPYSEANRRIEILIQAQGS